MVGEPATRIDQVNSLQAHAEIHVLSIRYAPKVGIESRSVNGRMAETHHGASHLRNAHRFGGPICIPINREAVIPERAAGEYLHPVEKEFPGRRIVVGDSRNARDVGMLSIGQQQIFDEARIKRHVIIEEKKDFSARLFNREIAGRSAAGNRLIRGAGRLVNDNELVGLNRLRRDAFQRFGERDRPIFSGNDDAQAGYRDDALQDNAANPTLTVRQQSSVKWFSTGIPG